MNSLRTMAAVVAGASLLLTSCLDDGQTMKSPTQDQLAAISTVTTLPDAIDEGSGDHSTAMSITGPWVNGTAIDARYTCDGMGVSPPLAWTGSPEGTQAYGIVLRDNTKANALQWVIANIDPGTTSIGEGAVPTGSFLAVNSSGKSAYFPPCPSESSTHSYTATVYALSSRIAVTSTSSAAHVIADMDASVLEVATTDFLYSR
jgi:Raf kinase inhibitor-like YbhB/YbcL family protein